jgi:pimeloyl-ACP methyl ester carboxylesterase
MASAVRRFRSDARSGEPPAVARWRQRLTPVTVDGLRSFALDEGFGDPVVFLHGIPTQAYLWRDVARVVSRDRRVVAPDLLGFGFSDRPGASQLAPSAQAAYLRRGLTILGVDRFALVAHDFGALVAAELLALDERRVTGLVLTNTSLWSEDWSGSRLSPLAFLRAPLVGEAAFTLARPFMLEQAFRRYVEEPNRVRGDALAVYWHPFTRGFSRALLDLFRHARPTEDDFCRWRDALHAFTGPALVVWGAKDPTFRPGTGQMLANIIPNAHFERFEHANHFLQEDRPEALGRLIDVFLDGRYER